MSVLLIQWLAITLKIIRSSGSGRSSSTVNFSSYALITTQASDGGCQKWFSSSIAMLLLRLFCASHATLSIANTKITYPNERLMSIREYYIVWVCNGDLMNFPATFIFPLSISVNFLTHEMLCLRVNVPFDFSCRSYMWCHFVAWKVIHAAHVFLAANLCFAWLGEAILTSSWQFQLIYGHRVPVLTFGATEFLLILRVCSLCTPSIPKIVTVS
jgi:hypothetical protein